MITYTMTPEYGPSRQVEMDTTEYTTCKYVSINVVEGVPETQNQRGYNKQSEGFFSKYSEYQG